MRGVQAQRLCYSQQSLLYLTLLYVAKCADVAYKTQSGLRAWVDIHTPANAHSIKSSRGDTWELVFSDEFNVLGRDFRPGRDPTWTAIELPDGVNAALEHYSINATSTVKEKDGRGVLQIETTIANITLEIFNAFSRPPSFKNHTFHYRSGMLQSWNKFCFQGGLLEVVAKLPSSRTSPDFRLNKRIRVKDPDWYPTWPGIWMMGNLGRALFSESTNRVWPWSYNECNKELAPNQRINACDANPGFGLNPKQGRGAPEFDLIEGGGNVVSSSLQCAPGMPYKFVPIKPQLGVENINCIYKRTCKTLGANAFGIPTSVYAKRGFKSWYQKLKYAPNENCAPDSSLIQTASTVLANLEKGITSNSCKGTNTCPACLDANADFGFRENSSLHWGLNEIGGCMPQPNVYTVSVLCDPDNTNKECRNYRKPNEAATNIVPPFMYYINAISANTEIPISTYTDYIKYQIEWTMGENGYARWTYGGSVLFEIPAESIRNPPQDPEKSNYRKLWIEEPMYLIFNVAVSSEWNSMPPNRHGACYGDRSSKKAIEICDSFPQYMKIDYIRLYQDTSPKSLMAIGCDPSTHPTRQFIEGHKAEYEDLNNPAIDVAGGATCTKNEDCSVSSVGSAFIQTGVCERGRCQCLFPSWTGPRCTSPSTIANSWGPSFGLTLGIGGVQLLILLIAAYKIILDRLKSHRMVEIFSGAKIMTDDVPVSPTPLSASKQIKSA